MTQRNPKKTMAQKIPHILTITFMALLINGCSFFTPYKAPVTQGTVVKESDIALLQPGLTKTQVQEIMGPNFGQDTFNPSHWEYVFYTTDKSFDTKVQHHVILNFDQEGYLSNWKTPKSKVIIQEKSFWDAFFE